MSEALNQRNDLLKVIHENNSDSSMKNVLVELGSRETINMS